MVNSIAGGGRWPSPKKENGKIVRGKSSMKRTCTGSATNKQIGKLDDTSRKILAANSRTFGPEGSISDQTGISIFDPALCELLYTWFTPKEALIIDPFAGGSVRGIVASKLGRNYIGIELRKEQVDANKEQGARLCNDFIPEWICEDSLNIKNVVNKKADMIMTCPPYADLEVYSDDARDISNKKYDEFIRIYREILKNTVELLNEDRFAAIVVGEVRDKKTGFYYGFVPDTIKAMEDAGAKYYNEIILVTAVGSLPLRAGRTFNATRKIGKTHQNVLIFCKGDPRKAAEYCGEIEILEMSEENELQSAISTT